MFILYEVKVSALQSDNIFPNLTQILSSYLKQIWRDIIYVISTEVLFFFLLYVSMVQTTVIWKERTSDEEK